MDGRPNRRNFSCVFSGLVKCGRHFCFLFLTLSLAPKSDLTDFTLSQPRSQGLSSYLPPGALWGGKMREPGNEVDSV